MFLVDIVNDGDLKQVLASRKGETCLPQVGDRVVIAEATHDGMFEVTQIIWEYGLTDTLVFVYVKEL